MGDKIEGKRILYIGPLNKGTITTQRIDSLRDLGAEVISFDTSPYIKSLKNPISRRLAFKYSFGPMVPKLNKEIITFAQSKQFDIVWVNKGIIIHPNTVKLLKEKSELGIAIHYTADPAIVTHLTRYFSASIPIYSHCVTTKSYEVELYKNRGVQELIFVQQGYDTSFIEMFPDKTNTDEIYDVVFIGRGEEHYVNCIRAVSEVTENIAIWGPWDKTIKKNPDLSKYWKKQSVFGTEYVNKLREGKICLGLLCKLHPDKSTTRSFEIPAAGSFLLGERSDEHLSLYNEGVEAEFFESVEELKEKIRYYLNNEIKRKAIAVAGRNRCIESKYSNKDRLEYILYQVLESNNGN
ncbi:CgeB family protein [Neobacillus drentensis]|uniref:CgeB family protein n=1 Tax=Neobacillus drentensis TaxID=220684 RepID=UPI0030019F33